MKFDVEPSKDSRRPLAPTFGIKALNRPEQSLDVGSGINPDSKVQVCVGISNLLLHGAGFEPGATGSLDTQGVPVDTVPRRSLNIEAATSRASSMGGSTSS